MRMRAAAFAFLLLPLSLLPASRLAHASKSPRANQGNVAFRTVDRGLFSLCTTPCYYTIVDAARWNRFWSAQSAIVAGTRPLPQIDFSHEMVVVVGMGIMGSSGYTVTVSDITAARGRLAVLVTQKAPLGGVNWHTERPYEVVAVPIIRRDPEFIVKFDHMFCPYDERVFCGIPPWNYPVALGGKCVASRGRPLHSTCYLPTQRSDAERTLPIKPFDPSRLILARTHLQLARVLIESQTNATSTGTEPYAIHYLYGSLPPPTLVPVVTGHRHDVIPVFAVSTSPTFLDVTEYMDCCSRGTWLQQNTDEFRRADTNETTVWHGPWQFTAPIGTRLTLVVRSYYQPPTLAVLGMQIRAAAVHSSLFSTVHSVPSE